MAQKDTRPLGLREACLAEARSIVDENGLEKLSLREVARRLGVSHGAPYRHFPSRDHILAEIVAGAFADFAHHLDARPRTGVPQDDMRSMGEAYLAYALDHPLNYRLMFETALPDAAEHPGMMRQARHAFELLRDSLNAVHGALGRSLPEDLLYLDALFVWSTMHGLASALGGGAIGQLGLPPSLLKRVPGHALSLVSNALGLDMERHGDKK